MSKSDGLIKEIHGKLRYLSSININDEEGKLQFLRELLKNLNKFFFEKRNPSDIEKLQSRFYAEKETTLPTWKRNTEFLAIWDDYAEKVISFVFPEKRIEALSNALNQIFKNASSLRDIPMQKDPDKNCSDLSCLSPRQFVFIRIIHALQDFTQLLPNIDESFINKLKKEFNCIPTPRQLLKRDEALKFVHALGGADRNVDERIRYITEMCGFLTECLNGDPYAIFKRCNGDALKIFELLTKFSGIASKKANMLLRDFYEFGIWVYSKNLDTINIIADNRIMRIALRTGIINSNLQVLLNDLLDQYDYQYMLTVESTEKAFRKVWKKCKELNGGSNIVTYPARLDSFFFHLGNADTRRGFKGCCCPTDINCVSKRRRDSFFDWMREELNYNCSEHCPLIDVCPDELKRLNPPFAIQNNTWNNIFTNEGGGGGLRGA